MTGQICKDGKCVAPVAPSCNNGVLDGDETSRDCGGSTCPPCSTWAICKVDADCRSNDCEPTCDGCAALVCYPVKDLEMATDLGVDSGTDATAGDDGGSDGAVGVSDAAAD